MIFDRTQEDVNNNTDKGNYNATDLNRVGLACYELKELIKSTGYSVETDFKTDWTMQDFPHVGIMQKYLDNIREVVTGYFRFSDTPTIPDTMENLTFEGANNIEKALDDIRVLTGMVKKNLLYAGNNCSGADTLLLRGCNT